MSFGSDLKKIADKRGLDLEKLSRTVPLRVFGDIMKRTRVDTGLLRGNMQVTSDYPAVGVLSVIDQHEGGGMKSFQSAAVKPFGVTYLTNNLEYAVYREAEDGMMGGAVADFQRIVKQEAAKL